MRRFRRFRQRLWGHWDTGPLDAMLVIIAFMGLLALVAGVVR